MFFTKVLHEYTPRRAPLEHLVRSVLSSTPSQSAFLKRLIGDSESAFEAPYSSRFADIFAG